MSSSKDTIHVLLLACLIHILDSNILKALGLRSGTTPTRIQKISILEPEKYIMRTHSREFFLLNYYNKKGTENFFTELL